MNPHRNRSGEQGNFPFRSERICQENGQWYFHTREGKLVGPFRDIAETKKALAVFVAKMMQGSLVEKVKSSESPIDKGEGLQHMLEELLEFFRSRNESGEAAALAWARNRIAILKGDRDGSASQKERIDVLLYAMNQDQRFAYR